MDRIKVEPDHQNDKYLPVLLGELTDMCIFFLTEEGLIASWSGGCNHIKEYEKEEILGAHYRILFPERLQKKRLPEIHIEEAIKDGKFVEENWRVRKSGEEFWAHIILLSLYDDDKKLLGFAKITQDLTKEYKVKKELAERYKQLDHFAYTVAHDLKAPLRNVKTLTDILAEDAKDCLDDQERVMTMLEDTVKKMSLQIDAILKYSKATYDKLEDECVDMNRLVKEVIGFIKPGEKEKIEIENELPTLNIPETLFFQVFQNLIDNALKHNDKERPVVKIRAVKEDNAWHFIISDNGPGIEKEYLERVFEIFQNVPKKKKVESTGIGLGVVKRIISSRGGRVWVESEPGKGSDFHFTVLVPDARGKAAGEQCYEQN